jgi:enterochelin esterase-like enzyme
VALVSSSQLRKHDRFRSRYLPAERDLIVYLPPGYDQNPTARFPVLYLQDGQNLFDSATAFAGVDWRVGRTADQLITEGRIRALVAVGIYNTGKRRIREYTPTRDRKLGGGGADRYARMLVKEIKPFIDSEYRTLSGAANTGLGGSSLGGLLTLYLGLKFPGEFGRLAALSPSVWWDKGWILDYARTRRMVARPRIWLDVGMAEGGQNAELVRKFSEILRFRGWKPGGDLEYDELEGAQHNEAAWSQRVGPFLQFLFPAVEAV